MAKVMRKPRVSRARNRIPAVSILLADLPADVVMQVKRAKLTDEQVYFFHLGYTRASRGLHPGPPAAQPSDVMYGAPPLPPRFQSAGPAPGQDGTVFSDAKRDAEAPAPAHSLPDHAPGAEYPYIDCRIVKKSQEAAFRLVAAIVKPERLPEAQRVVQELFVAWERGGYDRMPSSGRADIVRRLDGREMLKPKGEKSPIEQLAGSGPEVEDDAEDV
uniref:Uncharacterized protein n=1 Tax=viral metagenome TaxID=1070528 RepID=A0A6M3IYN9_9ZZZZ